MEKPNVHGPSPSRKAHLALGEHLFRAYRDYDRALAELALAQKTLPNEPLVFELIGFIERRHGRWEDSTNHIKRALELDPRNLFLIQQLSITYETLRRYPEMAAVLDRDAQGNLIRKAGVMGIVLAGGIVRISDAIGVARADGRHDPLEAV